MRNDNGRFDTTPVDIGRHMVPTVKKPEKGKPGGHTVPHWIYRIIIILALCALAVLGWYNRDNLAPANVLQWVKSSVVGIGVGDGFPKTFSGSTVEPGNFLSCEKNVIYASDTALTVCNPTGKELLNFQHSYGSPAVCAAGSRVLLYNLGGKDAASTTVGGSTQNLSVNQSILGGAISADGHCALISGTDGYCGKLTAFTPAGKALSYYWFSDYYPTAVALNPSGTKAAVTGVSAKDGSLVSAVYIINLSSGKTVLPKTVCTGNLFHAVAWNTENTVEAVGDSSAVFLNASSGEKKEYGFGGSHLTAYSFDGGRLALGLMPFEGSENQKFVVLDESGSPVRSRTLTGKISSVSLFGQTAAALSDGKIYFEPLGAGPEAVRSAGNDACAVTLKDETSAYVLGISEVRLVNNQ